MHNIILHNDNATVWLNISHEILSVWELFTLRHPPLFEKLLTIVLDKGENKDFIVVLFIDLVGE